MKTGLFSVFSSLFFGSIYLPFPFAPISPIYLTCFEKDSSPVDTEGIFRCEKDNRWECEDLNGNKYQKGYTLTSCCECLIYTCVSVGDFDGGNYYRWNVSVSDRCCENCDGVVYKADSVIDTTYLEDECETIESRVCRILPGHPKALIETDFSYKACCNDESKTLNALNTTKLDSKICSERQCFYSDALLHSTWISHQIFPGCDCCELDGKLVEDGTTWIRNRKTFECCRGDIVIKVESPPQIKGLFIASGAINGSLTKKTALYVPDMNRFCWLTPLDTVRRSHTTNQFTVCGGCDGFFCPPNKTTNNCETFDPLDGTWGNDNVSLKSVGVFYNQSSWTMEDGAVYLIGGQETNNSAIVKDRTVKEGVYSYKETKIGACIINDPTYPESYILTGGSDSLQEVQYYDLSGPINPYPLMTLPPLNYGRIEHGCTGYFNSEGGYVLLVTGGKPGGGMPAPGSEASRTTEILDLKKWKENLGHLKWAIVTPGTAFFPFDYENSVAATINNIVYMFGLGNKGTEPIKVIRKWVPEERNWTDVYNFGFEWGSTNIIASNVTLPVGFNFDKYQCYN